MYIRRTGFIVLLIISFILPSIYGLVSQPYLGEYFDIDPALTRKVIFSCEFQNEPYEDFDTNQWIGVVSSVTGANSTSEEDLCAMMYQNMFDLRDNGQVRWEPQVLWYGQRLDNETPCNQLVGYTTSIIFYGKTYLDYINNDIIFKAYAYNIQTQVEYDSPTVYTYTFDRDDYECAHDQYFVVGKRDILFFGTYGYFQVGIESNWEVDQCYWRIPNTHMGYYSSGWKYKAAKSIQGDVAYLTNLNGDDNYWVKVGGYDYDDTDKYSSSSDSVIWEQSSGDTYPSFQSLWATQGTVDQTLAYPFS